MNYGYARVSTREQNEDRQLIAMSNLGIPRKNMFVDKQSGKDFDRPQYKQMVKKIKRGDVLYLLSIDRLGRNYDEIQNQWKILTKEKGIDICVIDMPILDTRPYKDLLGTFVSDLFLSVLSFVAQNERDNIRKRQAEGIAAAKARGVKFGRPEKSIPDNFFEVCCKWKEGYISLSTAADLTGLAKGTFYSKAKKLL